MPRLTKGLSSVSIVKGISKLTNNFPKLYGGGNKVILCVLLIKFGSEEK